MSDPIDRQAAIDAINKYACNTQRIYKAIKTLPSAQPESCEFYDTESHFCALHRPSAQSEIVRCKDCKHWEGERRGQFYYFEQCSLHECTASSDDFCSWAERREE